MIIVIVMYHTVNWDRIFGITCRYTNKGGNESVHNSVKRLRTCEGVLGTPNTSLLMGGMPNFIFEGRKIQKFQANLRVRYARGNREKERGRTHKV